MPTTLYCKRIAALLFFLFFFLQSSFSEEIKGIGVPYIQNYSKSTYLSGNQNWSIAKSAKGLMYFGNAQGLLTYDGKYWQQYEMPNRQIVRSVATDASGKIYTGSFGEFGYWSASDTRLVYHSLSGQLPKSTPLTEEIWKIYTDKNRVIFQSFSKIYLYQNKKLKVVSPPGALLFLHKAGNRFFAEVLDKGLFELVGSTFRPLKNNGPFSPAIILSVLPYKNGSLLIGTKKNGLFIYDGQSYQPFKTEASQFLETYQLNNGVKVMGKYFAYGTILNGLIILDEEGKVIQRINKASGLQNNTILSLYVDDEENLWTGLDNGIDRVELNSPLYYYFDKVGKLGTVYSSLIYENNIYLGTNQGLYVSPWKPENGNSLNFTLIPKSQGQVWDLSQIDGQLLCGHNEGTFQIKDGKIIPISRVSGGWTIKKLKSNPDYLIQGTYNGLVLYKKDGSGQWVFFTKIENFGEPSRYVEQDDHGDIWISHAYKGIYRLSLSKDFKKVISSTYYDERNGLPGSFNVNVFNFENKLVFSSDKGFYVYDEINNHFNPYTALNKKLGSFMHSNRIIHAENKKYWFIDHGKMSLADFTVPGKTKLEYNRFSVLDGRMVQYYENISKISNHMFLISVDDGFVVYDSASDRANRQLKLPSVLIRNIYDLTDTYRLLSETGLSAEPLQIAYSRNNIRISYALPHYRQSNIRYQYYLEGYSHEWSDWSQASQKDFTNLSWGKYRFLVRASLNGQFKTSVTAFEFYINPPLYASTAAIVFYIVLFFAILYVLKKAYDKKLLKDKIKITARLQLEKEAFLKREAELNEKQIIKLEREKLEAELSAKNREIANAAMSLVYKNELLQKLSQEISKLKDEGGKKLPDDQQRKIQSVITEGMNDVRDWNLFENSFNEAHESFFKKLKAQHPDLVPNDIKLCAFLYMNMSSKEMASLLNISLRGVEIRRYRLRKKLNVPHDKNLVEFLMGI